MKEQITVVDYGLGNLFSVVRALEYAGAEVKLTESSADIGAAAKLVLPGVGAFEKGMKGLNERGLTESLREFALSGKPFLGICLGMQMLFESAEEFGLHEGLGLIQGKVVAIPKEGENGKPHKIPHVGWTEIQKVSSKTSWDTSILSSIKENEAFYFVHSFMCVPTNEDTRLADSFYNGHRISAVVRQNRILGCQFHPEKSGPMGLKILTNFVNLENKYHG